MLENLIRFTGFDICYQLLISKILDSSKSSSKNQSNLRKQLTQSRDKDIKYIVEKFLEMFVVLPDIYWDSNYETAHSNLRGLVNVIPSTCKAEDVATIFIPVLLSLP